MVMDMIKVLYYHYFLVYKSISRSPHFYTTIALSVCFYLVFDLLLNLILLRVFSITVSIAWRVVIYLSILFLIYYIMNIKNKLEDIINDQPRFFNNRLLSYTLTLCFFLFSSSILFWGEFLIVHLKQIW
jgi:hypothetical protein